MLWISLYTQATKFSNWVPVTRKWREIKTIKPNSFNRMR